jgi:hypothetical protein
MLDIALSMAGTRVCICSKQSVSEVQELMNSPLNVQYLYASGVREDSINPQFSAHERDGIT